MTQTMTQTRTGTEALKDLSHKPRDSHKLKIFFDTNKSKTKEKSKKQIKTLVNIAPELFNNSGELLKNVMTAKSGKGRAIAKLNDFVRRYKMSHYSRNPLPRFATVKSLVATTVKKLTEANAEYFTDRSIFSLGSSKKRSEDKQSTTASFSISEMAVTIMIDALNNFIANFLRSTGTVTRDIKRVVAKPQHFISACKIYVATHRQSVMAPYVSDLIDFWKSKILEEDGSTPRTFMTTIAFDNVDIPLYSLYGMSAESTKTITSKCGIVSQSPWVKCFTNVLANNFIHAIVRDCLIIIRNLKRKTISPDVVTLSLKNLGMVRC